MATSRPGQQWRHGWIPLTPAAVRQKNHGRVPGPGSKLGRALPESPSSTPSTQMDAAIRTRARRGTRSTAKSEAAKAAAIAQAKADQAHRDTIRRNAEERRRIANQTPQERRAEQDRQDRAAGQARERERLAEARRAQAQENAKRQQELDRAEAAQRRRDEARRAYEAKRAAEKAAAEKERQAKEAEAAERERRLEGARLTKRGVRAFQSGDPDKAIELFEQAARADPGRRAEYEKLIRQVRQRTRGA